MMRKAGVVFEKPISEWFDPSDTKHLRAWVFRRKAGVWPAGFVAEGVWEDPGWEPKVAAAASLIPDSVVAWADEYDRLTNILLSLSFPGRVFVMAPLADDFCLQVRPVGTDEPARKWLIPPCVTEADLVATAFHAVMDSIEQEARRCFLYKGKGVFRHVA